MLEISTCKQNNDFVNKIMTSIINYKIIKLANEEPNYVCPQEGQRCGTKY